MGNPLAEDLDRVLAQLGPLWEGLRGARVFLTGGTGFFGCWLLETLLWANDRQGLDVSVVLLTRNAQAFGGKAPHLSGHPAVSVVDGDVRTFPFVDGGFSHVIHAATTSSAAVDPILMFDTIVAGTRRALEFARRAGASRFLFTSSGAVYGRQPVDLTHVPEAYQGGPDTCQPGHAYAEGKRAGEMLCAIYADARLQPTIARCFTLVGPYLPLDAHFAAGSFIRDGLRGGPICIAGDGTPHRSYLYGADLAVWLWTILLRGQPLRPYNVGSDAALSIAELAQRVARQFTPQPEVRIARPATEGTAAERYVPSTARARQELGVTLTVDLDEAVTRTIEWHRRRDRSPYAGY